MMGLEELRFVSNPSGMEGVQRAAEAALVLFERNVSEEKSYAGFVRLVTCGGGEAEVWILANRVLRAVSQLDVVRQAPLDLCDCSFHGHGVPLVACSWKWKVVERGVSWPGDLLCRWRAVPDEVALALARFGNRQAIEVADEAVRFVDGKRTTYGSWPVLAPSLGTVVAEIV